MYLKPRQVFENILVESATSRVDEIGRVVKVFEPCGRIFGCITKFLPSENEKFHGIKHNVTHKIVARWGSIAAKVGDKLISGDKIFLVEAVDDALGQFAIYFVTQRGDLK